jgi:hypothetical protein
MWVALRTSNTNEEIKFCNCCIRYDSLGDLDWHLLQTIGICYLLPTYAAQLRTTADASTTPRGNLKSRMFWMLHLLDNPRTSNY